MKVTVKKKEPDAIPVVIGTEFIKLEAALKFANAVPTGGIAKTEIQEGNVLVNGVPLEDYIARIAVQVMGGSV